MKSAVLGRERSPMLDLQHNLVSILYAMKGLIEAHMGHVEENRFRSSEEALSHAHEMMKKVDAQVERAILVTKRVRLAMTASKKREEPTSQVSIQEVWNQIIHILINQQLKHGLAVINHIPEKFPEILCDKNDLAEILYCLADNAIQAMNVKGKLIIRVNLGFRPSEDPIATITIADTGPGIPEENLSYLFEPFMTTKSPEKGNGLGLCIVRGLVQKNGGTISVSSFKGCGTTFTLTFAVAKAGDRKEEQDLTLIG